MKRSHVIGCTCLFAMLSGIVAAAPVDIGRLLFTPQERIVLDKGGRLRVSNDAPVASEPNAVAAPVLPSTVQLQGYVAKPGGDTVWINGESVRVGQTNQEGISPQKSQQLPRVPVKMKDGRVVELKVGEEFDPNAQTVERINVKKH